jgi:ribosomal protein L19
MKMNSILKKFESSLISSNSYVNVKMNEEKKKSKKEIFHQTVRKGDIVSVIYYDVEKEQTRLQQFTGVCRSLKAAGLNTKLSVYNTISKITIQQQFFLYSKIIADVIIVRKKN